ncbi:MAG: peptidylprolyl isomerase [Parvularculaceae bacterium]
MAIMRGFIRFLVFIAAVGLIVPAFGQPPAPAAGEDRTGLPESYQGPASAVAAVVGDDVITTYDLKQRVRLMVISSGGQVTPDLLGAIQGRALRDLIEEKLKIGEAKFFELEAEPDEIAQEMRAMAGQSGLSVPQLEQALAAEGVSMKSLETQISAGIVWPRLVQGRYGKRVRVDDDQIEAQIERMREEATSEQYLVSEVCIPVPSRDQAQRYYEGGLQLIEQMRRGVPFAVVAQQFSACTSAAAGGDLGWVRAGELPDELDDAVRELPPGSVTNPILSEGAFMILAVRDKREAKAQGEKTYALAYASAPVAIGRAAARQSLEKLADAGACEGRRQDLGPDVSSAFVDGMKLSDIDERFHAAIDGRDRGDLSPIVEADGHLHVAYVCELDEGLGIPSFRTVEDRLFGRQLNRIGQQYLRDVERKTMVDVRLQTQQPEG